MCPASPPERSGSHSDVCCCGCWEPQMPKIGPPPRKVISKIHSADCSMVFFGVQNPLKILCISLLTSFIQDLGELGEHAPANAGNLAASPRMFEALMLVVAGYSYNKHQESICRLPNGCHLAETLQTFAWHNKQAFSRWKLCIRLTITKHLQPMTLCRDRRYLSHAIFLCFLQ